MDIGFLSFNEDFDFQDQVEYLPLRSGVLWEYFS